MLRHGLDARGERALFGRGPGARCGARPPRSAGPPNAAVVNLTEFFDRSLVGRRDRAALEYADTEDPVRTFTFGQIDARANRMAHELSARGLARGDRLCVQLANGLPFLDLFLACTRLGVIFVPVNVLYRERELKHILADSAPKAFVASRDEPPPPAAVPVWDVDALGAGAPSRSLATHPRSSFIRRARPARRRAPCSRTTTSPRTARTAPPPGASPTLIATSPCFRCFTSTVWATVCTPGSSAVVSCVS